MSALKDGMVEIVLDKPRKLLFDLNVMDAINEKYGDYRKLGEVLNENNPHIFGDIKYILALLMNEATEYQNIIAGQEVEKPVTEKYIGMIFNPALFQNGEAVGAIFKAFNAGTVGNSGTDEESEDEGQDPTKAATTE